MKITHMLLNVTYFAITLIMALLLFNSFMTISVAQANHTLDKVTGALSQNTAGSGIGIESSDGGFVISTKDGSAKVIKIDMHTPP